MQSASPTYFQSYNQEYNKEFLPFSPFMDPRSRDKIFSEIETASNNSSSSSAENDDFVPLDLTVKSPRNSPSPDEYNKRKFENSDSEGESEENKRQRSFVDDTKVMNPHLGPLSIVPPTPNPYMNPDLLSPLSLAPVPTPYMPLYNIGSPAPPTSSSSSMNLTPPQTPQATSFPSFLPFQMPSTSNSQMPEMPYPMHMQMPYYFNQMANNPYSPQMHQLPYPSVASQTPSPPPTSFDPISKKVRKILPKPSSTPPLMQRNHGSPPLQPRGQEPSIPSQTMTVDGQTIHIKPLSSPPVSAPPTSSYSNLSQMTHMPSTIPPPLMSLYPPQPYPGYLPYPHNPYQKQQFMPRQEPKPMSQALSFLFEKSLGSVRRWRENGITIQVFYCAVCQMPTDSEDRMRTHIETFHRDLSSLSPSASGVYQCQECDQVCSDEASLARHKLIHVNTNIPKEKCKGCGRNFATQESLANHEKDCSLYRPYRCEHCGRGYVVAARLKHHRQDCSAGPKPPIFTCKVCSKTFQDFMEYCQHVPVHAFM